MNSIKGIIKANSKKTWHFLWEEDTFASWIANIVIAFLFIRFIVYPMLAIILGTNFPIVAVVSESMQHDLHNQVLCGKLLPDFKQSFNNYWDVCGKWYENNEITSEQFKKFPFRNGFDKGDVIILWRADKSNLNVGDVLVFQGSKPQPIIHRIVKIMDEDGKYFYQTKGDHNSKSIVGNYGEMKISENRIYGKGLLRIPFLGWVKIFFVDAVRPLGINIVR